MKFIKSQTKSAKIKKMYILSCLLTISILILFQFTQALFMNKSKEVVTNIRVGDLRYEFSSTSFNPNTTNIIIGSKEEKTVTINITNLNQITTKYELYHEPNVEGIEVAYINKFDKITETITPDETKVIMIYIKNNTEKNITVTFKINSGFGQNELSLKNTIINEYKSSTENIEVDIVDNMIPVSWDGSTLIKADKSNDNNSWYDYDNQKWANAVLVTNSSRETIKTADVGTTIAESNILAYYTYIPRYRYLLWNVNNNENCLNDNCNEQEIKIEFEKNNETKSSGSNNGDWLTHPAFTFGESELNGIWIGKFTTSADSNSSCYTNIGENELVNIDLCDNKDITPRIKPNADMWRYLYIGTMYSASQTFKNNNIYGLVSYSNVDSHLMKNMDWGAVTYLSHSKYGKYGNNDFIGSEKQVFNNNFFTSGDHPYKMLTGCSAGAPVSDENRINCPYPYPGQTLEATGASTTGNIYGVYDMSGGANEYVMGQIVDSVDTPLGVFNTNIKYEISEDIPLRKYYNSYLFGTLDIEHHRGQLGDATKETLIIPESTNSGWYGARTLFPKLVQEWFLRGGGVGLNAGITGYLRNNGVAYRSYSFRTVLVIE